MNGDDQIQQAAVAFDLDPAFAVELAVAAMEVDLTPNEWARASLEGDLVMHRRLGMQISETLIESRKADR